VLGPLALAVAVAGIVLVSTRGDQHRDAAPLAVTSDGPSLSSLEELVDASDLVVFARARSVSAGRSFGSPRPTQTSSALGIVSAIVQLEVGAVLAGMTPGATVSVEEEATAADGRPLIVDGLRPTRPGDQGLFFLRRPDPSLPYFVTVSTTGRFLRRSPATGDDRLLGTSTPLGTRLAGLGGDRLTDLVVGRARDSGRPVGPLPV
jgi:hypothetical protein